MVGGLLLDRVAMGGRDNGALERMKLSCLGLL